MGRKPRREWASGSIYRHGDRWRVSVSLGSDAFGKRVRKEWQVRSHQAAERKLKEVQQRLRGGLPAEDSRVTVGVYSEEWLAAVKSSVRASTWAQYESVSRNHVRRVLGHLPLIRVTPRDVRALLADMESKGYSASTRNRAVAMLSLMSQMAMSDGVLSRNVAALVPKVKSDAKEPRHFTAEQARRFLEVAKDDDLCSLWAAALGTGLRRSELLGLTWRDLDLGAGTVTVRRSKTAAGVRVVPLPAFALEALRELERTPGPIWTVSPWWVSRKMGMICERAGLLRLTFHELRHSAATLMAEAGVPLEVRRSLLGHSRTEMTMHYSHVLESMQREAVERLDKAVNG